MKLPIQYALCWPAAAAGRGGEAGLGPGDAVAVRAARLRAFRRLAAGLGGGGPRGGTAGAVLNGANEAAVAAFLAGRLGFHEIVPACRSILENHNFDPNPTLAASARAGPLGPSGGVALGLCLIAAWYLEVGHLDRHPRGRRRPGAGHLRPRVGPLPRGQALRREVREVLPGLRHRRAEAAASSAAARPNTASASCRWAAT